MQSEEGTQGPELQVIVIIRILLYLQERKGTGYLESLIYPNLTNIDLKAA